MFGLEYIDDPEKIARELQRKFNPKLEIPAPIEKLPGILGLPVVEVDPGAVGGLKEIGRIFSGWTRAENGKPIRIEVVKRLHKHRRRFTLGHEAAHVVCDHIGHFKYFLSVIGRPGPERKSLVYRGIDETIRHQFWRANILADEVAERLLCPDEQLREDINSYTFWELVGRYQTSPWCIASSIVRVSLEPCVAFAFTGKQLATPIIPNNAAKFTGLYTFMLTKLYQEPQIKYWPSVERALQEQKEIHDQMEINGFILNIGYYPTKYNWYFRGLKGPIKVIALGTYNSQESKKKCITQSSPNPSDNGSLICIYGPVNSKTVTLNSYIQKLKDANHNIQSFSFLGEKKEDDGTIGILDSTGAKIIEMLKPGTDTVVIKNGHILDNELIYVCDILRKKGKRVIVAGASTDWREIPFTVMGELIAMADESIHCKGKCFVPGCSQPATRSQLIGDFPDDMFKRLVTDEDSLIPACSKHHISIPLSTEKISQNIGISSS